MHILLTGGTGLIGSALVRRGLTSGDTFTILSRQSLPNKQGISYVKDLHEIEETTHVDYVINLAGEPVGDARWTKKRKQTLIDSRVQTTEQVIEFISKRNTKPDTLISASAVGWYGDQGSKAVTETSSAHMEFTHKLCDTWEKSAMRAEGLGIRVCLLRIGLVVAPKGGFLERMLPPFKFGLGGKLGSGKQYIPWIHIDDIVSIINFLIAYRDCSGIYNATAPKPLTNQAFTKTLGTALDRPTFLPVPEFMLKLIFGEMSRLLLSGQKAIPERLEKAGYQFKYAELKQALESTFLR